MGAPKKEASLDVADTQSSAGNHDTDPSSLPRQAEASANDGYGFLPTNLPDRDAVADVLRGLKDAQNEAWAPTPAFAASSEGAEFAAYQARHAPAPRHDTPAPAEAVIVNVTQPIPEPAAAPSSVGSQASADVTQLDLATIVERSANREADAAVRDERAEVTAMKVRSHGKRRPTRALPVLLISLGAVVVLGSIYVFVRPEAAPHPQESVNAATSFATAAAAIASPPSTSSELTPVSPPAASTAPLLAVRPNLAITLAPAPSGHPRPHALPSAAPAMSAAQPKHDAVPKTDFVW